MANKRILCIVGKTSSGKDTIANYITRNWGIPQVCSYTTRPMRDYEIDGVQHKFVSKEVMKNILDTEDVIAYTINDKTGIEYCATLSCLADDITIYIINPDGVAYLKEHFPEIELISLYVFLPNDLIIKRGKDRGDNLDILTKRLESETEEFDKFFVDKCYDYCIDSSYSKDHMIEQVNKVISNLIGVGDIDDKSKSK